MSYTFPTFTLFVAVFCCTTECWKPNLRLYRDVGCGGERIQVVENVSNLTRIPGWDTKSNANIHQGTYAFYEHPFFNEDQNNGTMYVMFLTENGICGSPFVESESVRIVGSPEDCNIPVMTFYRDHWFGSTQEVTADDVPKLKIPARSLIFTGNSAWTVYTEEKYGGGGFCFEAVENCQPTWSDNIQLDLGLPPNTTIQSSRKGCFSKEIRKLPVAFSRSNYRTNRRF